MDVAPQSIEEPKRLTIRLCIKTVFHLAYLVTNVCVSLYGLVTLLSVTEEQVKDPLVYTLKYYVAGYGTNWNYSFQTIFLSLALTHDALEWVDKHRSNLGNKIRYWRDVIYSALVVPYTLFVFLMFWILYTIDRELVFPKVYDEVVPWWFNQCVHTNIMVMIVLETILQPRRHPTNKRLELILDGTVGIAYAIVYYSIYFFAHRWLYNVFGIFNWWQCTLFQFLIWFSSYIFYIIQFPISRLIHGSEPELVKPEQEFVKSQQREPISVIGEQYGKELKQSKGVIEGEDNNELGLNKSWSANYRLKRSMDVSKL